MRRRARGSRTRSDFGADPDYGAVESIASKPVPIPCGMLNEWDVARQFTESASRMSEPRSQSRARRASVAVAGPRAPPPCTLLGRQTIHRQRAIADHVDM